MSLRENALNATDVAQILGVGRNAVYELAKSGRLKSYRMGRKLLFTLDDVNAYFESQCGKPALKIGPADANAGANAPSNTGANGFGAATATGAATGTSAPISEALESLIPAERPFLIMGEADAGATLAGFLQTQGAMAALAPCPGYAALVRLYTREADAAVVSLYDYPTNSCNTPFAQRLMPGTPTISFRIGTQRAGFVVAAGNPKNIATWSSLFKAENRLINQPRGTSARVLLDQKATSMEYLPHSINGYWTEAASAHDAASMVEAGLADACIGTEALGRQHPKTTFVPMQTLAVDLVVVRSKRTAPLIKTLKSTLAGKAAHKAFAANETLNLDNLGAIVFEC